MIRIFIGILAVMLGFLITSHIRRRHGQILTTVQDFRLLILWVVFAIVGLTTHLLTGDWFVYEFALILGSLLAVLVYWRFRVCFIEVSSTDLCFSTTVPISYGWEDGRLIEHRQGLKESFFEFVRGSACPLDFSDGFVPNDYARGSEDEPALRMRDVYVFNGIYPIFVSKVIVCSSMDYSLETVEKWFIPTKEKNKVTGEVKRGKKPLLTFRVSHRKCTTAETITEDRHSFLISAQTLDASIRQTAELRSRLLRLEAEVGNNLGERCAVILESLFSDIDFSKESDDAVKDAISMELNRRQTLPDAPESD